MPFSTLIQALYNNFLLRFFSVFAGVWGIVECLSYFEFNPFKGNFSWFIITALVVFIIEEQVLNHHKKSKELSIDELTKSSPETLEEKLRKLAETGKNHAILRTRDSFSRNYLLEQELDKRIILGEYAEEAAIKLKDKEKQAAILIDDLGWSSFLLKKRSVALEKINYGLQIAKNISNFYYIAKAYRHKAAIEFDSKDYSQAEEDLRNAFNAAEQISSENHKNESLGEIFYGKAQIALRSNQYQHALDLIAQSDKYRAAVGDLSRMIKSYSLKGKILEKLNEFTQAKECFIIGLEQAKQMERLDEVIRNHQGLARIFEIEKNFKIADVHRSEANNLLKTINLPFEHL